jgi:adenylyltransferase/sulfurtransferase
VQLTQAGPALTLAELRARLATSGPIGGNAYLLRLARESFTLTLFPDGRAIVAGTDDIAVAKSVYAKYVGN